jgi:CRP-like cAMP-binding protein
MKSHVTRDELRSVPLFEGASDAALDRLASEAGELTSSAGQVIALEGDAGSGMFVILEGTATVEWRGGEVDLQAGTFFGELTLLAPGGRRNARVRAATDMRSLAIPRGVALDVIESEPAVALAMLKEMARRFASALPDD